MSEIEQRISELLHELSEQEVETRFLRSEVANLERAAVMTGAPSSQIGGVVAGEATGVLSFTSPSENSNNKISHRLNHDDGSLATKHRKGGLFMPEEFVDELISKRNNLIKVRSDYLAAKENKRRTTEILERNREAARALRTDLERLYEKTKWKPGSKKSYLCPISTENENSRLKKQLLEAYAEAQRTQEQMNAKTSHLKELTLQLDSLNTVEEEHFKAQTELRLKNAELRAVEDEINSCKRIYQQKDKYYNRVSDCTKDKAQIRHIDADKRVAQTSLLAHKEQARQADAGIRHRALLIRLLEERIEIIGEAIRGDASPTNSDSASSNNVNTQSPSDVPRVDVQFVDRIRNEITRLSRQIADNNHAMDIADYQIECAEDHAQIIDKSKHHTTEKLNATKRNHEIFNAVLESEVGDHRTEVVDKLNYYEAVNAKLRTKIEELKQIIEAAEVSKHGGTTERVSFGSGGVPQSDDDATRDVPNEDEYMYNDQSADAEADQQFNDDDHLMEETQ